MPVADVVNDWVKIIEEKSPSTILVMDSYYMDPASRSLLSADDAPSFIAAFRPDRFKAISEPLRTEVTESGESAYLWNSRLCQTAVHHWSLEPNVGKNFVLSDAFIEVGRRMPTDAVPVCDHYKESSTACDAFKMRVHGKTWPYRSGALTPCGTPPDFQDGYNFLFTAVLLNVCAVEEDRLWHEVDFKELCDTFAGEIMEWI